MRLALAKIHSRCATNLLGDELLTLLLEVAHVLVPLELGVFWKSFIKIQLCVSEELTQDVVVVPEQLVLPLDFVELFLLSLVFRGELEGLLF